MDAAADSHLVRDPGATIAAPTDDGLHRFVQGDIVGGVMGKVREDAAGLNIAYLLPCVTRALRSPLECRGLDTIASILLGPRSEEHTSELQSRENLVCRLLLDKTNILKRAEAHT